jgi:class 3 adenylate cyclase
MAMRSRAVDLRGDRIWCNPAAAASRRLQGPPDTSSARSSLPLSRTGGRVDRRAGGPPHFCSGSTATWSSSAVPVTASATMQKRGSRRRDGRARSGPELSPAENWPPAPVGLHQDEKCRLATRGGRPATRAAARRGRTCVRIIEQLRGSVTRGVHDGVRHGVVVYREGDYFGRAVNLAARLLGLAGRVEMFGSDGVVRATAGRFEAARAAVRTSAVSVRRCPCTPCARVRMPSTQRDGRQRSGYKPHPAAPLLVVDLWLRRRPLWDALRGSDYTSSTATSVHGKGVLAEAPSCSCWEVAPDRDLEPGSDEAVPVVFPRGQRSQDFRPRLGRQRRWLAASAPAGRVAVTRVALSPRTVTG